MTPAQKKLFINAMSTLISSWGSEAPIEAIWAANEFVDFYEALIQKPITVRFVEDSSNVSEVFEKLEVT